MTIAQYSDTAMVAATVGFIVAFLLHSAEWAFAGGLAEVRRTDGSEDAKRINVDLMGRLGVAATVVSTAITVFGVVTRGLAAGRPPWGNMYEFVTAAIALASLVYLLCVWRWGMRWLGLGVTLLSALMLGLAVTVFYVDVAPLVPALHSVWFVIHIIAAVIAAAGFNVAGIASILYIVRSLAEDRAIRRGEDLTGYVAKLPTLKGLDTFAHRMHAFAFPVWTFTIVAGAIWAQYAWGRFWNWDPKETWSFITWVVYAGYLHASLTAGWRGRRAAAIAVLGLVTFWFNFIGVNLLFSGLHSYAGI
jgi:cytochrome c-type biogenesis protein CcsB